MMGGPPPVANRRRRGLAGWLVAGGLVLGPAPVVGLGCGNDGRVIPTEYLPPSETLTDEELIARCAEAAPDAAGEGCPEGCVAVGLFDGDTLEQESPWVSDRCWRPGSDAFRGQVCAPTRGVEVPQRAMLIDPSHPEWVAYTHGCGEDLMLPAAFTGLTWLPVGWSACSGAPGEPSKCRCATNVATGSPHVEELFLEMMACTGVDLSCGFGRGGKGPPLPSYEEETRCLFEALRDRQSLVFATYSPLNWERYLLVPGDGSDVAYEWRYTGEEPILDHGDDITAWPSEHACSPPGYGDPDFAAPRMIIRCRLRSPEAYQACLDVADVGDWKDFDCEPIVDCELVENPWDAVAELCGGS